MAHNKNRANRDKVKVQRGVSRIHDPTRDALDIATRSVRLGEPDKRTRLNLPYNPLLGLREVEDRRTYPHEIREGLYRHIDGTPARIAKQPSRKRPLSWMPSGMHDLFNSQSGFRFAFAAKLASVFSSLCKKLEKEAELKERLGGQLSLLSDVNSEE